MPVECAERWQTILPNCSVRYFEAAGHYLDLERPNEIAAAIIDFAGQPAREG
jgi:pimeloyl-ACP methyl ester carboxylesterase